MTVCALEATQSSILVAGGGKGARAGLTMQIRQEEHVFAGWGCSAVLEGLPSMHRSLGSILSTA